MVPVHIETGHCRNLEERVCFNCPMEVESEQHVILHCNVYNDICDELFLFAYSTEYFRQFSPDEELIFT